MKPIDKLITLLKQDKVIPVIGAGFSYAVARLPGWQGAIESGLAYAKDRGLAEGAVFTNAQQLLNSGKLVQGADIMKQLLNAPNHPFSSWLQEMFCDPEIVSADLIHSVNDLCTPYILTTNYDDLLYSKSRLKTKKIFDWSEHQETAVALQKKQELILHLHGVYEKPETIILSEGDYQMLSRKKGYKTILQKLWTDYHFLFIGCSQDGVMDQDFSTVFKFLHKWFPSVPHDHFILFHEKEFANGAHKALLTQCNVHAISYGNDHNNLPHFINSFNPNKAKLEQKMKALKDEIEEAFKRQMLLPSGEITNDTGVINSFIKENLPGKNYWIGSEQLKIFEKLMKEHSEQVANEREQFRNYQSLIKALVSVNDLGEKVDMWASNRMNAEGLDAVPFMQFAVLSWECLNRMPPELMQELQYRRKYLIHDHYFSGLLEGAINRAKWLLEKKTGGAYTFNEADNYFTENLKRVIESLKKVLEADADAIFTDIQAANLTPEVPVPFIVLVSYQSISLRKAVPPYTEFASLPADKAFSFNRGAGVLYYKGAYIIVGSTNKHCFFWNPIDGISQQIFFNGKAAYDVRQIVFTDDAGVLYITTTGNWILKYVDFIQTAAWQLPFSCNTVVWSKHYQCFFASKSSYSGSAYINDTLLYQLYEDGSNKEIFTKEALWQLVKKLPGIEQVIEEMKLDYEKTDEASLYNYPFMHDVRVKIITWQGEEIVVLNIDVKLFNTNTVLLAFKMIEDRLVLQFSVLMENKGCYAYDFVSSSEGTSLLCGYMSLGDYPPQLLEYITGVNGQRVIVTKDAAMAIDSIGNGYSDIEKIVIVSPGRALVLQGGKKLYDMELPSLQSICTEFEELLDVLYIDK